MPFSKCKDVIAKVSDIVDGHVSTTERLRFRAHIGMCSDCRRYYEQFRQLKGLTGRVEPEDLEADFGAVMGFVMDEVRGGAEE
jgi:predicted anti-sigma-YlaC factor YlaD